MPLSLDFYPSAEARRSGEPVREHIIGIDHANGRVRWLSVSAAPMEPEARPAAVVLIFRDVTERRDYEVELHRLAEVDELTGLPNRRAFLAVLADHLASRRREDSRGALLVLDLDRFKELNDTLGHAVGDRVLVHAARAMEDRLRTTDYLGRLAGDEFAVLLPRADRGEAEQVAQALARAAARGGPADDARREPGERQHRRGPAVGAGGRKRRPRAAMRRRRDVRRQGRRPRPAGCWRTRRIRRRATTPPRWACSWPSARASSRWRTRSGARLDGMTDLVEIAEATVEELHRAFGYHLCAVIRVREDDLVEALAVRGSPFVALAMRDWTQPVSDGMIGRCLRERAPLLVNDVHGDPDYVVTPETADVRSELVAPLLVEGSCGERSTSRSWSRTRSTTRTRSCCRSSPTRLPRRFARPSWCSGSARPRLAADAGLSPLTGRVPRRRCRARPQVLGGAARRPARGSRRRRGRGLADPLRWAPRSGSTAAGAAPATPGRCPTSRWATWPRRSSVSRRWAAASIHPGDAWSVCRTPRERPFGLAERRSSSGRAAAAARRRRHDGRSDPGRASPGRRAPGRAGRVVVADVSAGCPGSRPAGRRTGRSGPRRARARAASARRRTDQRARPTIATDLVAHQRAERRRRRRPAAPPPRRCARSAPASSPSSGVGRSRDDRITMPTIATRQRDQQRQHQPGRGERERLGGQEAQRGRARPAGSW